MRLFRRLLFAVLLAALPMAGRARAQGPARVEVSLATAAGGQNGAPMVRSVHIFNDHDIREMLHSGFPARLHYRLELWGAAGFFDDLKRQIEWDVIVRYNPLKKRYTATRIAGDKVTALGSFDGLDPIEVLLAQPSQPAFAAPDGHSKYYYNLVLDVQMLSVSDLDEVERWLKGDLGPAVHGEKNPGTALGQGAKQLITKLLGGQEKHYEARSKVFRPR
ncbi:MAG: hypothetical protein ABIQ10_07360 [Gemmatimonadaceae bacterium]